MKLLTLSELATLTRDELLALQDLILIQLLAMTEGDSDYAVAEANLENIRATLARRSLSANRPREPAP